MKYLKEFSSYVEDDNSYEVNLLKDLTKFTIPYGDEDLVYDTIQKYTKKSLSKDEFGNLYVSIGKSKILFTAHMDTYSQTVEEVNHVIENGFLKTDGKTILGGDNKVGCAILINMINNNVPGNYYFFCGEEVGRLGSEFHNQKIVSGQYELAITFDRKEIGSVCTYQRGMKLCNDNLSEFLIQELSKSGFKFKEDYFGLSCDTFTFHEKVNNCLNISTGVYDEHKKTERVDLKFYKSIFNLCPKIDWKTVEILSGEKVREKIDVNRLKISDDKISQVLEFFIKSGYNPTGIPTYDQNIGIYTSNLYFKLNPKIFDYFHISIKKSGLVQINGTILTKEKVLEYINSFKKIWQENVFDGVKYHIMDLTFKNRKFIIELLKDDEEIKIEFDRNLNLKNEISVQVIDWIKKILIESNILSFYKN